MPGPNHKPFIATRPVGGSYTFGGRQGRMSPTRQRAFDELVPRYAVQAPSVQGSSADAAIAQTVVPDDHPIIVEIGCGAGEATVAMAEGDAGSLVIACEPNNAMTANLAVLLDANGVTNVRLWLGDAFDLLQLLGLGSVTELRIWFPDPWPKPRQGQKRLITPQRLALLTDSLVGGGRLRLATDDAAYAAEALAAIAAEPRLEGAVVGRPPERPITRFEARGLREGRTAIDIEARKITPAAGR